MKGSGSAFPYVYRITDCNGDSTVYHGEGMTLRDWFAGQALAGYCSRGAFMKATAAECYGMADAMLKAREETK